MKTICNTCGLVIEINGDPQRVKDLLGREIWGEMLPCPRCELGQAIRDIELPDEQIPEAQIELTPEEYFRALHGFGFPDEINCPPEVIRGLLLTNQVVGVGVSLAPKQRTVLNSIELENGLTLHLGISTQGPVVFKITRKAP
jgi:hypothetical protein